MSTAPIIEQGPRDIREVPSKAITLAILAMGGEGGGVLADWIVDLAEHAGYRAQATSVPGVAQRTGSTIYYLELFPEKAAQKAGKEPVLALMPVPGEVDIVVASELMEAARAIERGLVTRDRTVLIASTNRVYSMIEKTEIGDGRLDSANFLAAGSAAAKTFVQGDFSRVAEENGSVISAALFGALAASRALPFSRDQFESAIQRSEVGVKKSLAAFSTGFDMVARPADLPARAKTEAETESKTESSKRQLGPRLKTLAGRVDREFPAVSHDILLPAIERLADYQDESYASEYLTRLAGIRDVDRQYGKNDFVLLRETGRYLALWMSYEDASRVADLKIRRTRFARVQRQSHTGASELVQINEFLYPRVEEIADTLPAGLGAWLLKRKSLTRLIERIAQGGTIVHTTSVRGFLLLYAVAEQRRWRRKSLRFRREHEQIGKWLAQVLAIAPQDYSLAREVAECPRLIKGYGDTHRRGTQNFETLMNALPRLRRMNDPASSLRTLREAALADEQGKKLAAALEQLPAGGPQ